MLPTIFIILTSTMARSRTLRLGEGARCNVLVKNLRPSREITERILNPLPRQRVTDLVATRRGIITRGRSSYEAFFFTSPTFPNLELHAARRFTVVDAEGHPDRVWTTVLQSDGTEATPANPNPEQEIDPSIFRATDNFEDIARVRAEGFEVDDDNEALPENRPALDAPPIEVSDDGLLRGQEWGWDGLDQRVLNGTSRRSFSTRHHMIGTFATATRLTTTTICATLRHIWRRLGIPCGGSVGCLH